MLSQATNSAEHEEKYITNTAYLSLMVGILFFAQSFENTLAPWLDSYTPIFYIWSISMGVGLLAMMTFVVLTIMSSNKISRSSYWLLKYDDEFFNYVNSLAYKWAFNIVISFLFVCYMLFDAQFIVSETFQISELAKLAVGVALFAYGAIVLFKLKSSNDE